MKKIVGLVICALCAATVFGGYPLKEVPWKYTKITGGFWQPVMATNHAVTLQHALKKCSDSGTIENFKITAGITTGTFKGVHFDDSNLYKVFEGMAYALANNPTPKLRKQVETLAEYFEKAQQPDGYLDTFYTIPNNPKRNKAKRWSNVGYMHELYNMGHFIEGACAHYKATGKTNLLAVAERLSDCIGKEFGPGKRQGAPGHQEIETALARLYQCTGDKRHLKRARFFLDERGRVDRGWYSQNHMRLVKQDEAVGHAVRAVYCYMGMADIAALQNNTDYHTASRMIWDNVARKKLYLSGGVGSVGIWEGFDKNYRLPNRGCYLETCGPIAMTLWGHKMFLMEKDAKYMDVVEVALYNGVLGGVSLTGNRFYYGNQLETSNSRRFDWHGCPCCPTSISRIIPSVARFMYAVEPSTIYVNLYAESESTVPLKNNRVEIRQKTDYPRDGKISLSMSPKKAGEFTLALRIPAWSHTGPLPGDLYTYSHPYTTLPEITVNGKPIEWSSTLGYAKLKRTWKKGDTVSLTLPMEPKRVVANPAVPDDRGRVAMMRGPVLYCLESLDNEGEVFNYLLSNTTEITTAPTNILGGIIALHGNAMELSREKGTRKTEETPRKFTAVPFYTRDNRERSKMNVWLLSDPAAARYLPPLPTIASTSKVTAPGRHGRNYINDGREPIESDDNSLGKFHWGGARGTNAWVQYEFAKPETVSRSAVYWFDDYVKGTSRVPKSWRLLYRDNGEWKPVRNISPLNVEKDMYNTVDFVPVTTDGLRIEAVLREGFGQGCQGGIHEWRVFRPDGTE